MDKIHVCIIASMFPYISITDVHVSIIDIDVSISVSIIDIDVSITDVHVSIIDVDVSIHLRRSGDRMRAHDMTHPSLARHPPPPPLLVHGDMRLVAPAPPTKLET